MRLSIFCFAVGIVWLQQQASLPDRVELAWLAVAGTTLLLTPLARFRLRGGAPIGAFLLGIAWAGALAQYRLADALATIDEGRDLRLVGVISSMPQRFENGVRFEFRVEQAEVRVPEHISLAWYQGWRREIDETEEVELHAAPPLHAGERWQLTARLKRPHGNMNPAGFDYEAWLLEAGIRATGYVRTVPENRRLDEFVLNPANLIEKLREDIRERFYRILPEQPYAGVLVALAVGDQRAIDSELWQLFSRTGITHLMSISGLHVTLFASLVYALLNWLWRRSPMLPLVIPAQRAAVAGGFIAALLYCLIAGFAVPAQRTLYMLAVVVVALWMQRAVVPSRVLALALLAVLLVDPWAVLAAGFWLSFGAVGLLFYVGSGRLGAAHWLREWGRTQWAVTLGSLPALLLLFQQFSLVSPLANALAIPVVGFVVTPLVLAAAVLPPLGFLLYPAHLITTWLMSFIEWLAELPWAVWQQHAPPTWAWLTGLLGCVWLLLPRGFPARWLGLMALLPLLLVPPLRPAVGEAKLVVLDVGQGLAMHIQTASHDLLYDTGPLYSPEANSGNRVIAPYLRALGVARLDGLVVTHQDTDHSGGAEAVLDAVAVDWLMSSLAYEHGLSAMPVRTLPCSAGQAWEWDGVRFEVLHPLREQYAAPSRKTNDMSCVLMVSNSHGKVLLTSDIEAISEKALLERAAGKLRADLMIVPHHGSRTSSTPAFIRAVGATQVIFPVGYRNHFGHPKPDVVERYRQSGARMHRTDMDGALTVSLTASGVNVAAEREERRRYWHMR
ncbi:MAG: DNA internalization-related competence protein ComEC/Rec2 [Betaproteobacteria bacterium]|nr:DNA internalization-related competence protein ComEC/Rec2 [Betaproteobacteria bacterium]